QLVSASHLRVSSPATRHKSSVYVSLSSILSLSSLVSTCVSSISDISSLSGVSLHIRMMNTPVTTGTQSNDGEASDAVDSGTPVHTPDVIPPEATMGVQ
ncbi:hypothetical protein LINPERHAP1_LOCUS21518, partial [Linum perenne]